VLRLVFMDINLPRDKKLSVSLCRFRALHLRAAECVRQSHHSRRSHLTDVCALAPNPEQLDSAATNAGCYTTHAGGTQTAATPGPGALPTYRIGPDCKGLVWAQACAFDPSACESGEKLTVWYLVWMQ
jgi:hypothetical protein